MAYIVKMNLQKGYIGSSQNLYERIKSHIRHTRYRINKALSKHGIPYFIIYIIEYAPGLTRPELEELEREYWYKLDPFYNSDEPGYITPGYRGLVKVYFGIGIKN